MSPSGTKNNIEKEVYWIVNPVPIYPKNKGWRYFQKDLNTFSTA